MFLLLTLDIYKIYAKKENGEVTPKNLPSFFVAFFLHRFKNQFSSVSLSPSLSSTVSEIDALIFGSRGGGHCKHKSLVSNSYHHQIHLQKLTEQPCRHARSQGCGSPPSQPRSAHGSPSDRCSREIAGSRYHP